MTGTALGPPSGVERAAALLTAAILASRVWFVFFRYLDLDEFEHAHVTWALSRGLIPYRDFFEHHTPWLYLLFAPMFPHFATDTEPHAVTALLFALRLFMWGMTVACVVCVYILGRMWQDRLTGIIAAFFVASASQFQNSMLEFRPDVPALLCLLVSLTAVMRVFRSDRERGTPALLVVAGFALGASILFTQKMVCALPGMAFALIVFVVDGGRDFATRRRARAGLVGLFVLSAAAPLLWTASWFDARGALDAFIYHNIDVNLALNSAGFSPAHRLWSHLIHSPALMVLGFGGFVALLRGGRAGTGGGRVVLLTSAASLFAGVFLLGRVYDYYLIYYFPHLAVFAATWSIDLVSRVGPRLNGPGWLRPLLILTPVAVLAALLFGVDDPTSRTDATMVVAFTAAATFAAAAVAAWLRARGPTAACCAMVALVSLAGGNLAREFGPIAPQLADLTYVAERARPQDTVLSYAGGSGVFRPHAWYKFFLGGLLTSDREFAELTEALETGLLRPKFVELDAGEERLRRLPPAVRTYVRLHYRRVHGELYERVP